MREMIPSKDYLVDYYAVLEIPRDATDDLIRQAYRTKSKEWSNDRLHGMAPALIAQAQQMAVALNGAYAVLNDAARRAAYDAQLAGWQGVISENGLPMYALDACGGDFSPEKDSEIDAQCMHLSGYNPVIITVMEQALAAKPGDAAVAKALSDAYGARETYLALRESFLLPHLGLDGEAATGRIGADHQLSSASAIEQARQRATDAATHLALNGSGGESPLLGTGDKGGAGSALVVQEARAAALRRFDEVSAKVQEVAAQRASNLEKRLAVFPIVYHGDASPQPRLVAVLAFPGQERTQVISVAFRLKDGQLSVDGDESLRTTVSSVGDPREPEAAAVLNAAGASVASAELLDGVDAQLFLQVVCERHAALLYDEA